MRHATRQLHVATTWMLEQVTRLEDGDYEQLTAVHGFRDCPERATAQNNHAHAIHVEKGSCTTTNSHNQRVS